MDDVEGKVTEAPLRFHYDNFYTENRQIRHVHDARTQGIQIHTWPLVLVKLSAHFYLVSGVSYVRYNV